jgi:branched-chain amino acid transport system substrate-binding protein
MLKKKQELDGFDVDRKGLTRRDWLKITGGVGITAMMGGFVKPLRSKAFAAEEPIKIGHITPRTGFIGQLGAYAILGARLAVEEANAKGGVLGRLVEVVYEDSVNPGIAVQKARKLIEKDKVQVLVGEINSASSLAISDVAQEARILFINTGAHSDEIRGTRCHRYNFSTVGNNTMYINVIGQWLIKNRKFTKWYFLTADYTFGHDAYRVSKKLLLSHGGTELGNDLIPTGTTDYSSYILKLKATHPDLVFLSLGGADQTTFLKQYSEFGAPFEISGASGDTVQLWAVGPDALAGVWPCLWYHDLAVPAAKEFTDRFMKKFEKPPDNRAWSDYTAIRIVLEAIGKTGSTESRDLVTFLESGVEFDGYKGRPCKFREWDHQLMQPIYVVRPKKKGEMKDPWDIFEVLEEVPGKDESLETIMVKKEESGCKLESL